MQKLRSSYLVYKKKSSAIHWKIHLFLMGLNIMGIWGDIPLAYLL